MAVTDDANETGPAATPGAAVDVGAAASAMTGPAVPDDEAVPGPDGWVRVLLALAVGVLAGALIALLLPRDDGPRRVRPAGMPPATPADPSTAPAPPTAGADGTDG